jgi:hypothetical protein
MGRVHAPVGSTATFRLHLWPEPYGIASLRALPDMAGLLRADGAPTFVVAGHGEISVMAPEAAIDALGELVERHERGWRALTFDAVLDLSTIGLLAAATRALAAVEIPVMAFSSHDTDHLLVPAGQVTRALVALGNADLESFFSAR